MRAVTHRVSTRARPPERDRAWGSCLGWERIELARRHAGWSDSTGERQGVGKGGRWCTTTTGLVLRPETVSCGLCLSRVSSLGVPLLVVVPLDGGADRVARWQDLLMAHLALPAHKLLSSGTRTTWTPSRAVPSCLLCRRCRCTTHQHATPTSRTHLLLLLLLQARTSCGATRQWTLTQPWEDAERQPCPCTGTMPVVGGWLAAWPGIRAARTVATVASGRESLALRRGGLRRRHGTCWACVPGGCSRHTWWEPTWERRIDRGPAWEPPCRLWAWLDVGMGA